uniref:Uncharacterized protein n=1 Tax=Labrus bergylta TaxID=56723 RepID=A0A3Q3L175_9LABR
LFCSSNGGKTNFTSLSRTCSTTPQDQTVSEDGLQLCDAIISPNIGNIEDTIPNDFLRSSMEGEETTTLVLKGFLFYSYFIVILSYAIPAPVTERSILTMSGFGNPRHAQKCPDLDIQIHHLNKCCTVTPVCSETITWRKETASKCLFCEMQ